MAGKDGTSGPAHRVQSAQVEYGFPTGHLGHLSGSEEKALREFKDLAIEKGLFAPKTTTEGSAYGTDDDAMLLRFLRARRFNVHDALGQMRDTAAWRKANEINTVYETIDLKEYDETRALYPQWTGRRDRRGIPVYVFEVKHLNAKTMAAYEKSASKTSTKAKGDGKTPAKLLRLFALYENLTRYTLPMCTTLTDRDNPRTPITQSNNIVDISGVGLKQFWNLRAHMQDASQLATAHYPETLDRIFIIGAPSFFPTVWGWVKRWFDPITTSKIFILSSADQSATLRQFIEPANIPKKYGGELDFEFGKPPNLDPVLTDMISWEGNHKDFPHGPLYWVDRGDKVECRAVGSVSGKQRNEPVASLPKKVQTFDLDHDESMGGRASIASQDRPFPAPGSLAEARAGGGRGNAMAGAMAIHQRHNGTESPEPTEPSEEEIQRLESNTAEYKHVVQSGEVVSASRPEPKTFHTAHDGLENLTLSENPQATSSEAHTIPVANLLDPAVNKKGPLEHAHLHHEVEGAADSHR